MNEQQKLTAHQLKYTVRRMNETANEQLAAFKAACTTPKVHFNAEQITQALKDNNFFIKEKPPVRTYGGSSSDIRDYVSFPEERKEVFDEEKYNKVRMVVMAKLQETEDKLVLGDQADALETVNSFADIVSATIKEGGAV